MGWILDGDELRSDDDLRREEITQALRSAARQYGAVLYPEFVDEIMDLEVTAEEIRNVCALVLEHKKLKDADPAPCWGYMFQENPKYTREELQAFENVMSQVPEVEPEEHDCLGLSELTAMLKAAGVTEEELRQACEDVQKAEVAGVPPERVVSYCTGLMEPGIDEIVRVMSDQLHRTLATLQAPANLEEEKLMCPECGAATELHKACRQIDTVKLLDITACTMCEWRCAAED